MSASIFKLIRDNLLSLAIHSLAILSVKKDYLKSDGLMRSDDDAQPKVVYSDDFCKASILGVVQCQASVFCRNL